MADKKRIVILGAGFGGIYAYLGLKKHIDDFVDVEIVLVNKKNYFLFVPMIHEVATGNLSADSVVQPIRQAIDACNIKFIEGQIEGVDLDRQEVRVSFRPSERSERVEKSPAHAGTETNSKISPFDLAQGKLARDGKLKVKYDYLVSALGSVNNFFNTPGAENCLQLKDLKDAQKIRRQVIGSFEQASVLENEEDIRRLLAFVIIGGGPTGVELAAEIADLVGHELKKAYPQLTEFVSIHLIHGADKLMGQADDWFHDKSAVILQRMGVKLHLQHKVTQVSDRGACFDGSEWIDSSNIFWTAGVKAAQLNMTGDRAGQIKYNEGEGRIGVGPTLQVPAIKNIFVVGDQMCLTDKETGQPYPMRAQFAAREGSLAGYNIAQILNHGDRAKLREFKWADKGFIVSLGRGGALAQIRGFKFSGPIAWWLYRTAYLFKLVGTRAKLKTAYEWTINLFLPRDISKF